MSAENLMGIIANTIADHLPPHPSPALTNILPVISVVGMKLMSGIEVYNTTCSSKEQRTALTQYGDAIFLSH